MVEDNPIIAMTEKAQLEDYGYMIAHESNGEDAVKLMATHSSEFDLILMDIDLGSGIDGTQAAEKILKTSDIPIIFLSSYTDPNVVEKTEKITSYGYVVKNSGITILDTAIKMAFRLFAEKQRNKEQQNQLQYNEEMFRELFEQSRGYCLILDPNTEDGIPIIVNANNNACLMHGYKKEELIGRTVDNIDDDEGKKMVKKRTAEIMTGKPFYVENIHLKKDGSSFPVAVYAKRINLKNRPPLILSTEFDITEERKIEDRKKRLIEEKDLLLQEVHHRIKNNISSIENLLKMNIVNIHDNNSLKIIKQAVGQVECMRIMYDKLLISDDFGKIEVKTYITSLIDSIKELYLDKQDVNISYSISNFTVDAKTISSIGFITNELISNCYKHGFINRDSGNIDFLLLKDKANIKIQITDDGVGVPKGFTIEKASGFGLNLIKALTAQLNGKFSMKNKNGTNFVIDFSIENF